MIDKCEACRAPVVREGDRVQFDSSQYHMDAVKKLSEISCLRGVVEDLTAENEELQQQIDALQQKVHLCAGYDQLYKIREAALAIEQYDIPEQGDWWTVEFNELMGDLNRALYGAPKNAARDEQDIERYRNRRR